jgi:hypothetical protein
MWNISGCFIATKGQCNVGAKGLPSLSGGAKGKVKILFMSCCTILRKYLPIETVGQCDNNPRVCGGLINALTDAMRFLRESSQVMKQAASYTTS